MQREYLILMQGEKSCGAVKIEQCSEGLIAEITADPGCVLQENHVFKAYLAMPAKNETRYLGVLEDHAGSFVLKDTSAPLGIVLTTKNTVTGEEAFCCLCAEEGKLQEVRQCFEGESIGEEKSAEPVPVEPAPAQPVSAEPVPDEPTPIAPPKFEKKYLKTAEEKLTEMFADYTFERVNGFFLRKNSRIAEYIMGGGEVYRCIMNAGYYYFASKNTNSAEEFIIAVPLRAGEKSPFVNCAEYSFEIGSDSYPEERFCCVAAGRDDEGEYFCRKM